MTVRTYFGPNALLLISVNVVEDETGRYFVEDIDPSYPGSRSQFLPTAITHVTWKDIVYAGFRADGHYETEHASVHLKTTQAGVSQSYDGWARNYDALKDIALQIRTGKLPPKYDFTAPVEVALEPMTGREDVVGVDDGDLRRKTEIALYDLMETLRRCRAREISHSITPLGSNMVMVLVTGFVPKTKSAGFTV